MRFASPDINTIVEYENNRFPVESWIKSTDDILTWCDRKNATHIVCGGMIIPIQKVRVVGRVQASKKEYDAALQMATTLIGQTYVEIDDIG